MFLRKFKVSIEDVGGRLALHSRLAGRVMRGVATYRRCCAAGSPTYILSLIDLEAIPYSKLRPIGTLPKLCSPFQLHLCREQQHTWRAM